VVAVRTLLFALLCLRCSASKAAPDTPARAGTRIRFALQGPGLLLARTQGGARFGAFNNLGWASREDYRDSNGAFLMRWAPGTPADAPPEILAKVRRA
jgi:hypothetical protein